MVHHRVGVFGHRDGIPDKRDKGDKEGLVITDGNHMDVLMPYRLSWV